MAAQWTNAGEAATKGPGCHSPPHGRGQSGDLWELSGLTHWRGGQKSTPQALLGDTPGPQVSPNSLGSGNILLLPCERSRLPSGHTDGVTSKCHRVANCVGHKPRCLSKWKHPEAPTPTSGSQVRAWWPRVPDAGCRGVPATREPVSCFLIVSILCTARNVQGSFLCGGA